MKWCAISADVVDRINWSGNEFEFYRVMTTSHGAVHNDLELIEEAGSVRY